MLVYMITLLIAGSAPVLLGKTPSRWPSGSYSLLQSIHGCPDSPDSDKVVWSTGILSQPLKTANRQSKPSHMAANVTNKGVQRSFCTKLPTQSDASRPQWPPGKYCIYRKGNKCPRGLSMGSLLWHNRMDFSGFSKTSGVLPDGVFTDSRSLLHFCCAVNGNKSLPMSLPLEKPFYLMAYESDICQEIVGAVNRAEYIFYSTDHNNKLTPHHPYKASTSYMKIYYCYYQACWTNFTSRTGTIMSPFYPTHYPQSTTCSWTIALPKDFRIILHFDDVDLEPSPSCIQDWLIIRYGLATTLRYCNKTREYQELPTSSHEVVLEFHSNNISTANKGFRIRYTSVYEPVTTGRPTQQSTGPVITTLSATKETPTAATEKNTWEYTTNSETATTTQKPTKRHNTQSISSVVVRESRQSQSYDAWTVIVAVCLVLLVLAIVLVVIYFKCLRKRFDYPDYRRSVVKYSKKEEGDYVDMDCQSGKANPGIPVYDNYPSDNEGENLKESVSNEAANPIYETMEENEPSTEKSQQNVLYESQPNGVNIYEELPSPRKKQNNVYESASLPSDQEVISD